MRYWLPLFVLLLPYGSPVLINEKTIIFAGVKFKQPISGSLQAMKMTTPTPIQQAAIAPLTSGLSAILHAETGSGKTLAYLLPLLKRICGDGEGNDMTPMQALIIVPTKELAVQVAADIISLTSVSSYSLVHLCISSRPRDGGFDKVSLSHSLIFLLCICPSHLSTQAFHFSLPFFLSSLLHLKIVFAL